MTASGNLTMTSIASQDGTPIACFASGDGPPLVLVHGVLGDHTRWDALRPELDGQATGSIPAPCYPLGSWTGWMT